MGQTGPLILTWGAIPSKEEWWPKSIHWKGQGEGMGSIQEAIESKGEGFPGTQGKEH